MQGDGHGRGGLIERSILCRETDMVEVGWAGSLVEHSLPGDGHGRGGLGYEFSGAFFAERQIWSR